MFWTVVDSPIDPLLLVGDETGLRELQMAPHSPPPGATEDAGPLAAAADQLAAYFAGEREAFRLPLAPVGTAFQRKVWAALREIPYGRTTTYGELAAGLGQPTAARAVGLANGRNPIAVIVPCHRVIGRDGTLTGFGGGLDRKRWLLEHERAVLGGRTGEPVAAGLW
ncbi:MAG TPA: methylated-DNA--[protein]-cysteine S-methyltransferase [Mycobacteriales bacterium]|nr:methylated-DNA--[protein]-cysteine S-methyltransferase [Mycobacteriales bacterium]